MTDRPVQTLAELNAANAKTAKALKTARDLLLTAADCEQRLAAAEQSNRELRDIVESIGSDDDPYEIRVDEDRIHRYRECSWCGVDYGKPHRKSCLWIQSRAALNKEPT